MVKKGERLVTTPQRRRYSTDTLSPERVVKRIASDLRIIEKGEQSHRTFTYYDTFDWRLYTAGYTCYLDRKSMWIEDLNRGTILLRSVSPPPRSEYRLHDIPEGDLKETIATNIGIRALLPLAEVSETRTEYRILNSDRKGVCSLTSFSYRVTSPDSNMMERTDHEGKDDPDERYGGRCGVLRLEPLRGYGDEAESIHSDLLAHGVHQSNCDLPTLYLSPLDRVPLDYSGRSYTSIHDGMSIREAAREIIHTLLADIARNEPGIIDEIDPEFLHEYRVAVRRSRAFLSDSKKTVQENPHSTISGILKDIGTATNRPRDLDVLLMAHPYYHALLPESLLPGLDMLFGRLKQERAAEQEDLRAYLLSAEYRNSLKTIEELIARKETYTEMGVESVEGFALGSIRKRAGKLEKAITGFSESSSPADVHRLRIRIKMLRYLMEFYAGILPPGKSKRVIRALKRLQDLLGGYNDLTVQIDLLDRYRTMAAGAEETASAGGLMAVLYRMQNEEWMHLRNHADDLLNGGVLKAIRRLSGV